MDKHPVNTIESVGNTIKVNDLNTPIKLIFKDVNGETVSLKDNIDYFYMTKDDFKYYSVDNITFDNDGLIFKLPVLNKGLYKIEIKDKNGSIYPAGDELKILLKNSYEAGKEAYYTSYREDILNSVEPIIIEYIKDHPDDFKGVKGDKGDPGRNGRDGLDGRDGVDGEKGEKGDPGKDGELSFQELTPEEKESLRGERGRPGEDGKDGINGIDGVDGEQGLPGREGEKGEKGDPGEKGEKGDPGVDGIIENINTNLIPLDIDMWELGGKYTTGANWDNNLSIRTIKPFKIEEGINYTFSDKSNLDLRVSAIKAFIYKDGQMVQYIVRAYNQSINFLSEGDECYIVVDGRADRPLQLNDITNVDFKVKLEKGLIETPLIDAIHQNQIDIHKLKSKTSLLNYRHLAVGNDWTNAMQQALNDNNTVYVPPGEYDLGEIKLNSYNEVIGSGINTIFNALSSEMFVADGSLDTIPKTLITDTDKFGDVFNINSTLGLKRYDYVLLQSQRNCISRVDSGEEWTLGGGTNETQKLPFGEFKSIAKIEPNKITLSSQPIFPSYLSHSNNEVNPALPASKVTRVDFVNNVILRDFQVKRSLSGTAIRSRWAKDMSVRNVYFDDRDFGGYATTFIVFAFSLNCEAINCNYEGNVDDPATNYYHKNVYKASSSMYCGFTNCKAKGAGQTFDISFFSDRLPSTGCFADNCIFDEATSTGLTSHGGSYLTRFKGNHITNTFQGIGCRSRRSIIIDNVVVGKRNTTSTLQYGIGLYEGHAVDCIIKGNIVTNFRYGIGIFDAVNEDRWFRYTGTIISDNTVSNCHRHFYVHRHPTRTDTDFMGIMVTNNTFRHDKWTSVVNSRIAELPQGVNGITFNGNIFKGVADRPSALYGIYAEADCTNIKVINNMFIDMSTSFTFRGNLPTGSLLTVKASYQMFGNSHENVTNKHSIQSDRAQVMPNDDPVHMVSPDGRGWNISVDNNGNIVTDKYLN